MQIVLVFMVAVFAIPVQCQTMTLRNSSSSYLTYEGLVIEQEGAVALTLKTAQLHATVLYIQGVNDTFVYLHLVNGRMTLTLDDGDGTQTTSLPDPYNSNRFLRVRVVLTTDGMVQITGHGGTPTVSLGTIEQFDIMSPIFIGGIPDPPPFDITHNPAVTNTHFLGCVRRVQLSNGTDTSAAATAANRSSDVVDGCVEACDLLDCNPDANSEGECTEYYSYGVCDCRRIAVSEGAWCNNTANAITFDGSSYRCYSLPQYDSPFVEGETITLFIVDSSEAGTLMTGQQDEYQFSLSIRDQKLHYEALLNNQVIIRVSTPNVSPGTFQVNRNITMVEINSQTITLATASIDIPEFGSVRFTDICVGGGSINNPIYSGTLRSVYYNLHNLSASGAVFEERTRVSRVNFADTNAVIELPGNLADYTNIQLSFRTSQQDAMLLQVEGLSGYVYIFISNSQVHASLNASGTTLSSHCSRVNITKTTWYALTVEPVVEGCDANCQLNIALLAYAADGTAIDQCDLGTSAITSLSSASVVIGGINAGRGVDGLMGCVELMINMMSLNLEGVVNDNEIHTNNCESCDIMPPPCLNGGTCVPRNDYEFNCSCADPYFGDFCGMEPTMTSSMTLTTMATSSVMMTISTSTMTTTSTVAMSSSVMVTSEPTSSETSSVAISTTSSLQSSSTPTDQPPPMTTDQPPPTTTVPVPSEGGGDDDDVGPLIGIVLGIIVLVLLIILVVLIIIVVIRNRNNRRGFYPTNEGKGGEEMILKYSASLRSITRSGATSDGAENGSTINRVTKKEQEYYI